MKKGHSGVLLEAELETNEILLSDFMAWHVVLNDQFLALNEEEEELYDAGKLNLTKERSWTRIFEFEKWRGSEYMGNAELLQAVIGRIRVSRIKVIKEFTAK